MSKYIWLAVEADKYELPLAVAETAEELGEMIGVKKHTIRNCIYKGFDGRQSGRKYVKVRIDDEH
jgi:ribosomal protein L7Ae-like RNA K-turn-binding protein